MRIEEQFRKSVVFIGYQTADGTRRMAGTGFFVGQKRPQDTVLAQHVHLVTARHVIDGIRSLGLDRLCIRVNLKSGNAAWLDDGISNWKLHLEGPIVDVAARPMGVHESWDHLVIPSTMIATAESLEADEIGPASEVFVVGLFKHHHGESRNIPIVRTGTIAAALEEKVVTKLGSMDAYLIEARSIGGISGSPVFASMGPLRSIAGTIRTGKSHQLLGLVHGHFDSASASIDDAVADSQSTAEKLNTGIAIVVPGSKMLEVLDFPEVSVEEAEEHRTDSA